MLRDDALHGRKGFLVVGVPKCHAPRYRQGLKRNSFKRLSSTRRSHMIVNICHLCKQGATFMIDDESKNVSKMVRSRIAWISAALIDGVFLILWILIQAGVRSWIEHAQLSNLDSWMRSAFALLFAVSTLIPIAAYIFTDVTTMLFRSAKVVRNEYLRLREENIPDHDQVRLETPTDSIQTPSILALEETEEKKLS